MYSHPLIHSSLHPPSVLNCANPIILHPLTCQLSHHIHPCQTINQSLATFARYPNSNSLIKLSLAPSHLPHPHKRNLNRNQPPPANYALSRARIRTPRFEAIPLPPVPKQVIISIHQRGRDVSKLLGYMHMLWYTMIHNNP